MASCLEDPSNQFLSDALEAECRQALQFPLRTWIGMVRKIVTVSVPPIHRMGFAEFEKLIAQGKATGAHDIDPRIWGVIDGVRFFVKNWLGFQLSLLR